MNYIGAIVKISPKRTKSQLIVSSYSQGDSCDCLLLSLLCAIANINYFFTETLPFPVIFSYICKQLNF